MRLCDLSPEKGKNMKQTYVINIVRSRDYTKEEEMITCEYT